MIRNKTMMNTKTWRTAVALLAGLVLLPLAAPTVAGSKAITGVVLRAEALVEIDTPQILLGQIVSIESATLALKARLADVKIGRAATAGKVRSVSREYVLLRMRQSGFDPAQFDIRLPAKIQVQRSAIKITREEMEMMVRDHLQATPPSQDAQVNITAVRIKEDVLLPKGQVRHEVQRHHQSAPSRMLPVAIVFTVDGRFVRKVPALVSLEIIQNVVVSRKPIPRFKVITPEDVTLRQTNVVGMPDSVFRSLENVIGKRARRAISMHAELSDSMVEWPPVLQKGDRVLIVAESGNLRITARGEVTHAGKVGEQVRVVNLDSKKTIMAQVVDSRTVRVAY
jgi:flagella basal body P-ring formation protein FlgA